MNAPARTIGMSRRSLTGRVALSSGGSAVFESSLERDLLICLDFNPDVQVIHAQPFTLDYEHEGRTRRYTPDVAVTYRSGDVRVYEVKPLLGLRTDWLKFRPRFMAAVSHCRAHQWQFKIATETHIRTSFLENATFLRRYRFVPDQPAERMQLIYTLQALGETTPQGLLAATFMTMEGRMAGIPALWNLVATKRIWADLKLPLTMASRIRFRDE